MGGKEEKEGEEEEGGWQKNIHNGSADDDVKWKKRRGIDLLMDLD